MPDDDPHVIRADTPAEVAHSRLNRFLDRIHAARVDALTKDPSPPKKPRKAQHDELVAAERDYMREYSKEQLTRLEKHEAKRTSESRTNHERSQKMRQDKAVARHESRRRMYCAVHHVTGKKPKIANDTPAFKAHIRAYYGSRGWELPKRSYFYELLNWIQEHPEWTPQ